MALFGGNRLFPRLASATRLPTFLSVPTARFSFKVSGKKFRWIQWGTLVTFAGLTAGGVLYASKDLAQEKKNVDRSYGQPSIGGDFNLVDHNGKRCNLNSFRGKWILMYFGFCRCPDICPEQLQRLVEIGDRIALTGHQKRPLIPVFVTVDYERDTPDVVAAYVKEFSPYLVGLTGSKEEIDSLAKLYRIYYSAGPKDEEGDYINIDYLGVQVSGLSVEEGLKSYYPTSERLALLSEVTLLFWHVLTV
ncbi:unnamed protein product [Dicrocoelium dendriticum]|nr:unnamed protein product [Dicrocoelium dendriticum]